LEKPEVGVMKSLKNKKGFSLNSQITNNLILGDENLNNFN